MLKRLKIPKDILKEIKEQSRKLGNSRKIASGELFGIYEPEEASANIVSKQDYLPKKQNNEGNITWWDTIKNFPMDFLISQNEIIFNKKLGEEESCGIYYFSDLNKGQFDEYHKNFLNSPILENFNHESLLMYSVENDKFSALGEEEQPVNVKPVDNSKLKDYRKLDEPYTQIL